MQVSTLLGITVSIFMMVAENATTFAGQQEADAEPAALLSYNRDIRPILSENCFACHGSDRGRSGDGQTDLRLDLPEEAIGSAADVAAIVAGQPDQSEMWLRIIETDPDAVMPPPESKKKLTVTRLNKATSNYEHVWLETARHAEETTAHSQLC
jgi:mono/diheme cytochrome c family protein